MCRCSSGFCRTLSPPIHILAGEKVCIHATSPMHFGAAFASSITCRISSGVVSTGLKTTRTGMSASRVEPRGDLPASGRPPA